LYGRLSICSLIHTASAMPTKSCECAPCAEALENKDEIVTGCYRPHLAEGCRRTVIDGYPATARRNLLVRPRHLNVRARNRSALREVAARDGSGSCAGGGGSARAQEVAARAPRNGGPQDVGLAGVAVWGPGKALRWGPLRLPTYRQRILPGNGITERADKDSTQRSIQPARRCSARSRCSESHRSQSRPGRWT
jgi:hypothetical protein